MKYEIKKFFKNKQQMVTLHKLKKHTLSVNGHTAKLDSSK